MALHLKKMAGGGGGGGGGGNKRSTDKKKKKGNKKERISELKIFSTFCTLNPAVKLFRRRLPTLPLTTGDVSESGFRHMFAILPDNTKNARETNLAVNVSLSIFLCVPLLEVMMQRSVAFFTLHVQWHTFYKTKWRHPVEGAI